MYFCFVKDPWSPGKQVLPKQSQELQRWWSEGWKELICEKKIGIRQTWDKKKGAVVGGGEQTEEERLSICKSDICNEKRSLQEKEDSVDSCIIIPDAPKILGIPLSQVRD